MGDVKTAWDTMRSNIPLSLLDIVLVAITIYYVLRLLRGTRAIQLIKGLLVLGVLIVFAGGLKLAAFNWLLRQALLPGVIALIILFQPELRLALE